MSFNEAEIIDTVVDNIAEISEGNITVEYPNGRTYGECYEDERRSIRMINGVFKPTLRIKDKPFRLSRAEALEYYTKKLRKVWLKGL